MLVLKKIKRSALAVQVIITFKLGNFIWTRHTNSFNRVLAGVLLTIFHKRYSKNALDFLESEKTKDDSF